MSTASATALPDAVVDGLPAGDSHQCQADVRQVGGKALHLRRLHALGCRVPRFAVVTCVAFETGLASAGVAAQVARLEAALRAGGDWRELAGELRARLRAHGCGRDLWASLRAELERLGLAHGLLAVRSSAVIEDGARHSFAGLLDSVLGVHADDLPDAVTCVWTSAFSERVLAYRARSGLGLDGLATAVIVQRQLDACVSGVAFTRDPADPTQVLIAAGLGLGEGVVQATVECDTYRVARRGAELHATPALKTLRVQIADGGGTHLVTVPAEEAARHALDGPEVRALAALALRLERAFATPLDVEWALDRARRLHVLQARPITAVGPPRAGERRVWESANVVESYPGLTRPLTYSFARDAYARAFRRAVDGLLPLASPLRTRPHLVARLIGLIEGRVYYNLLDWYELFACLARPAAHRNAWNRQLGIDAGGDDGSAPAAAWHVRLAALAGVAVLVLGVRRIGRRFAARFTALHARFRDPAPPGATPEQWARTYHALAQEAGSFWHLTLYNDLAAMRWQSALDVLCRRFLPDRPELAATLLAAGGPSESVAAAAALEALAAEAGRDVRVVALFDEPDDRRMWAALCAVPDWKVRLAAHLEAWGERGIEELKLERPTLREEPWRLAGLLRAARAAGATARTGSDAALARRHAAAALLRGLGWPRRTLLASVARRARLGLRQRESMRLARARLFGLARTLFRRLGADLAERGVLASPDEVFDLTVDEVLGAVEGTGVTRDLHALVALRRREYAQYARQGLPARFETHGPPQWAARQSRGAGPARDSERLLRGVPCAGGTVTAPARVVDDPARASAAPGAILIASSTDPGWVFLMMSAAGLVAERGSVLSHTAIIGRELGLPTVVGVPEATRRIPDGALVTLDGVSGEVRWT